MMNAKIAKETSGLMFDFTTDPSLAPFSLPMRTYLAAQPEDKVTVKYLAVSAYVINESEPPRILLIQRAASDSMPNRWEVPGGACDDEDPTVLHSVARELWEEAGLTAARIGPQVGESHVFVTRSGKIVAKFGFLVDVRESGRRGLQVGLDRREHQNHVSATEEEVKIYRAGEINLKFTNEEQRKGILEALQLKSKLV